MKATPLKKTMTTLLALTAAATVASASAQARIGAQSIIVNPVQTSLDVNVWTDRGSAGGAVPSYRPGEQIKIYASVNQDAYVYLFNVDTAGSVDLILPNTYQGGANFVKANTTVVFPAEQAGFTFTVDQPYGLNKVLALASLTPLNLNDIATFKTQQNSLATVNVRGEQQLAQALSIVVNPIGQNTWITDIAYYNVSGMPVASTPVQPVRPVQPVQPVRPAPVQPAQPVNSQPSLLDLLGSLFGGVFNNNTVSPVKATFDQQIQQLQNEGYRVVNTRTVNGGYEATLQNNTTIAKLLVTQGQGRTVEVSVTRTTRYRY